MPRTLLTGLAISDGSVRREDLDVTTPGSAVIRKIIAGASGKVSLVSTGPDEGTGDVTIEFTGAGTGDVVGPASATGGNIARFANNTGKLLAGSVVILRSTGELVFPTVAAPLAATENDLSIYAKAVAGTRPAFAMNDDDGLESVFQTDVARQKAALWSAPGNSTVVPGVLGIPALTALGTATTRSVAVTNRATRERRLGYVSAATAGALAGHYQTVAQYTTGNGTGIGGFRFYLKSCVSDAAAVAGARSFMGMSNLVAAPTNIEPSTMTNCFGLAQLSTDNTQWYLVYGGSAAQTPIALGTALGAPTNTTALMELVIVASSKENGVVHYRVTNLTNSVTVVGTITPGTVGVQTPASGTLLAYRNWRTNNATLLAVGVDVSVLALQNLDA